MHTFDTRRPTLLAVALLLAFAATALAPLATAQTSTLGTISPEMRANEAVASATMRPLDPAVTETGLISASIDGCGTPGPTCTIEVDKPSGATVRRAYMAASSHFGFVIPDESVTINGTGFDWDSRAVVTFLNSAGADVTDIVKPIVDAAPAGITSLTIGETASSSIDGSSLVVIFDDPTETTTSTVVISFGGQALSGDTFNISLAQPFADADQDITLSLAIGFGVLQGGQFSLVDVNGERLSSSAGDYDDGEQANGALYTVGGVGDDPANPEDPFATDDFDDDELYTLDPFIDEGDTEIVVASSNPSNDDIIHLATFIIKGSAAIVGEGILLTPVMAENPVGTDHTVTARVQDNSGDPVSGREVRFEVLSGPNMGELFATDTDAAGDAAFTFSSDVAGTDIVVARFDDSGGVERTSNEATKVWTDDTATPGCTASAEIFFSDYETSPASPPADPRGEYAEISNDAGDGTAYDLSGCDFIVFDPFTENVIYAADVADTALLGDGGSYEFANVVVGNGQTIPANTFPDAPSAFALIDGDASVGMSVGAVLASAEVVAAVVVDRDGSQFGSVRGGTSATAASNAQGLYDALSRLYATDAEDDAGGVDLAVVAAPNPISSTGTVSFGLAEPGAATVELYDALGRRVALVSEGAYGQGRHYVDVSVAGLPTGLYIARVTADGTVRTAVMTVVR